MSLDPSPDRTVLWGGPATPVCLLDSLTSVARRLPGTTAVADEHVEVTYEELLAWAGAIAGLLREHGVRPRDRVAVAGPRGAAVVAAMLGIVAHGATYVPLDSEYPVRRLAHMLDDSGAKVLLHVDEQPPLESAATAVRIPAPPDAGAAVWSTHTCEPDLPVYVIYTSGSTGWPKGTAIGHRCLDNMVTWQCGHSPRPDLRTAQFAPLNFDVSFQEVLGALCGGGTLVVVPERLRRDPVGLVAWLGEHRVERLFLPYVALQMLSVAATVAPSLDHLRLVEINTAGEQMVCTPQIRELFARMPGCRLVNHYGQSESAMVTSHVLTGPSAGWPALPPIGVPLPGCEVLLDPADPADPPTGELLVAGLPVSLGYLNQPELNAARFIDIPPTPQGNTRAFRTGDLVSFVADGVRFHTRIDTELKIRGIRVDPVEVEAWLLDQPGVATACVVLTEFGARGLRAAVTLGERADEFDAAAALEALADVLPSVSVPLSITVVTALPRTPSGKTDRAAVGVLISEDFQRERAAKARS